MNGCPEYPACKSRRTENKIIWLGPDWAEAIHSQKIHYEKNPLICYCGSELVHAHS